MVCLKCGLDKPDSEFYEKTILRSGPNKGRAWQNRRCKKCLRAYEKMRDQKWYGEKRKQAQVRYNRRLKRDAIEAYGGKCDCCGEKRFEFLQVDHVNGGGGKHRREIKMNIYLHLKRLSYPKNGYRLLCSNCNSSLGHYGYCPHQNENINRDNSSQ